MEECNLHTIVRLPNSVFKPYASTNGEWTCKGRFKLARGEGDPLRIGHCGTVFKAGSVIVSSINVQMAKRQDPASPFYLVGLYLNRDSPDVTVIGGTFRSEKQRPDDVYCDFSARIFVR